MAKISAAEWIRTVIVMISLGTAGLIAYKNLEAQVDINTLRIKEECARSAAIDKIQDGRERQMGVDVAEIKKDISYMSKQLEQLVTELRRTP